MPILPATAPRADDVRLGIFYMVASVFLFSFQTIGKWLAQSYPIPMPVFFRSAVALLPSYMLVMRAGGTRALRTNRLGAQFGRAAIWGGSNVASFFAYHLLPLADAIALTFAPPLFLTALSSLILKERVGRERWIAVPAGFVGVLAMALIWASILGFIIWDEIPWDEVPTAPIIIGATIVTLTGLYLLRHEAFRRPCPIPARSVG